MELDCAAAGIAYHGDLDTADFHSIRVQFITALCRSADFSTAVELARHKDPRLTSRVYDRVRLEDRTAAINGLALPTGKPPRTRGIEDRLLTVLVGASGQLSVISAACSALVRPLFVRSCRLLRHLGRLGATWVVLELTPRPDDAAGKGVNSLSCLRRQEKSKVLPHGLEP
jgi:hypothetical protein